MAKLSPVTRRDFFPTALLVLAGFSGGAAQESVARVRQTTVYVDTVDASLFGVVLRSELDDSVSGELRVDPRPLISDPGLVTTIRVGANPYGLNPDLWRIPLALATQGLLNARGEVLARLAVRRMEADSLPRCPGALVATSEAEELRRRWCPRTPYRLLLASQPRAGGVYWPPSVDERTKYAGRDVWSVRVIVRYLSASGANELSTDYVFEHLDSGWKLLERRRLMIVE